MMKTLVQKAWKKSTGTLLAFLIAAIAFGQDEVEMADAMRESGKIYVVVAVILVIFVGLVIYLFTIDRKIKRVEDEVAMEQE